MAQLKRSQLIQLVVFCLYWFAVFPLIWFVLQPEFFTNNIPLTLLFALLLLGIYYLIYILIKCCCRETTKDMTINSASNRNRNRKRNSDGQGTRDRRHVDALENRVYAPTTTTISTTEEADEQPRGLQIPDAVFYENPSTARKDLLDRDEACQDEGELEAKSVRFITSCSLYYDGQGQFHDYQ